MPVSTAHRAKSSAATLPPRPADLVRDYVRNVGGDPLQTLRRDTATFTPIDSERPTFLDGEPDNRFILTVSAGVEISRQWNLQMRFQYALINGIAQPAAGLSLRFEDF